MLKRYSTKTMQDLWSDNKKYETWLEVEILSAEAYSKFNKNITKTDLLNLRKNAKINLDRINEIEKETRHDVIAFTRQVSETLGEEKKWIHYGLTSTDVVDTAQSLRLKEVNEVILKSLSSLSESLKLLANEHKKTYMIGRTHGVHAEVTTFGYKVALWYDEFQRQIERFKNARKNIEVAKISGAVGNYANIPLDIQDYVATKLGLASSKISSQTLQRDRHSEYISTIALIGSSLEKFSTEIRHLQRTEVGEVSEGFATGQKGSSAMPHKKNPISSENISGLSRVLRGYALTAFENINLWHERDISHSSSERIILADATSLIEYMSNRFNNVIKSLVVDKEKMLKNIQLTKGLIFSQRVLLFLIDSKNMNREDAYDLVQKEAMNARKNNLDFKQLLIDKEILTITNAEKVFDLEYYANNMDAIFTRVGI